MPNWGIDIPKGLTLKDTIIYLKAQPRDKINPNLPVVIIHAGKKLEDAPTLKNYIPSIKITKLVVHYALENTETPTRFYQIYILN